MFNLNYNLFRIYVNISRLLCLIQIIGNHDTVIPLIFLVDLGGNYPFNQWKLSLFLYFNDRTHPSVIKTEGLKSRIQNRNLGDKVNNGLK